ncbi:uncharacterized protein TNCT_172421 [Trichonephila clavata]|uniref:THAP-type domain-containing protein n=1 Tax=Trichonephila clavata TaxID=2740835 RepID=A0A8X6IDU7_TRICU|nr:uncharacterized protein TNCT_172421 [Trichonephila clavata]
MPRFCAAYGCANASWKEPCQNKNISFHGFPLSDKLLLQKWLLKVRRANFNPTRSTALCSEHFDEDEFVYQPFTNRRTLKKGAIPTKFSYEPQTRTRRKTNKDIDKNNISEPIKEKEQFLAETYETESSDSEFIHSDSESSDSKEEEEEYSATLLDVSMNEKFYLPEQIKSLTSIPSRKEELDKKIHAMKEKLAANIVLRTLKKQFLDAKIKAANARRDYYSTKRATLSKTHNVELMNDYLDLENNSKVLRNLKVRLKDEELAAEIEERMLQKQLAEAEMTASYCEKEYHKAKSDLFSNLDY